MYVHKASYYCKKYNIIRDEQYGFQKNKSTILATFKLTESIMTSIDQNKHTIALFFDMSKAFDFVDHSILLKKLEKIGIRGVALDWINSYLQNRMQCVQISNLNEDNELTTYESSYDFNRYGVPQGSILGPFYSSCI